MVLGGALLRRGYGRASESHDPRPSRSQEAEIHLPIYEAENQFPFSRFFIYCQIGVKDY